MTLVKRDYLDGRIYVIYGIIHWILVSGIVFEANGNHWANFELWPLDAEAYIVNLVNFALMLFIIFYYIGYKSAGSLNKNKIEFKSESSKIRFYLGIVTGVIGFTSLRIQVSYPDTAVYIQPLSFLFFLGSIISIVNVTDISLNYKMRLLSMVIPLLHILSSNTKVIYTLIGIGLIWILRVEKGGKPKLNKIITLGFLIPVLLITQMTVKVWGRNDGDNDYKPYTIDRLQSEFLLKEVRTRLVELDTFNIENYPFIVDTINRYWIEDKLMYGKSLLVFLPFLKLLDDDIRGAGRITVIDIKGEEYKDINYSMGVTIFQEMMINFGSMGLLIAFFYGYVTKRIENSIRKTKNEYKYVYAILFYGTLLTQQRGDLLFSTVIPVYFALAIYLISRIKIVRQ